nr:MAG TPA: hypothetical protein [Caudoviricetes sp.]
MLIRSNTNTPLNLLESMKYIEPVNSPAMVPIVENARIGANVVALEDIMKFSESNGIEDLGYALSMVCEASNVDKSTIAFSIQEESLIGYQYYSDIVQDILSENVDVFVSPISRDSTVYQLAESAVSYLEEYDDDSLLEAFVNNGFNVFYEATEKVDMDKVEIDPKTKKGYIQDKDGTWKEITSGDTGRLDNGIVIMHKLRRLKQEAIDKPRDWIAKQIAALNQKMREFITKAETGDPKKRGFFMKIKEKIARVIEWLTRKLTNIVRREKDTVTAEIKPLNKR